MTKIKEKAVDMIQRIPEDHMSYVIDMLQNMEMLLKDQRDEKEQAMAAYRNIQKFRGRLPENFDADKELEEARNEKLDIKCCLHVFGLHRERIQKVRRLDKL